MRSLHGLLFKNVQLNKIWTLEMLTFSSHWFIISNLMSLHLVSPLYAPGSCLCCPRVHTVASAHTYTRLFYHIHKAQYEYHVCLTHTHTYNRRRGLWGEFMVFMPPDPGTKRLSDPISLERLSSQRPAYECNSISAGTARPTADCKCRSEMESESSSRRDGMIFF